jgi:hypothetical protein
MWSVASDVGTKLHPGNCGDGSTLAGTRSRRHAREHVEYADVAAHVDEQHVAASGVGDEPATRDREHGVRSESTPMPSGSCAGSKPVMSATTDRDPWPSASSLPFCSWFAAGRACGGKNVSWMFAGVG